MHFTQKRVLRHSKRSRSHCSYWLKNLTHLSCLKPSQSGHTTNAAGKNPTIAQCHLLGKQDWKKNLMPPFSLAASNTLALSPVRCAGRRGATSVLRRQAMNSREEEQIVYSSHHEMWDSAARSWERRYLHRQAPRKPAGLSLLWVAG